MFWEISRSTTQDEFVRVQNLGTTLSPHDGEIWLDEFPIKHMRDYEIMLLVEEFVVCNDLENKYFVKLAGNTTKDEFVQNSRVQNLSTILSPDNGEM